MYALAMFTPLKSLNLQNKVATFKLSIENSFWPITIPKSYKSAGMGAG